tara:strand:- start:3633 stop:4172 length:540 start_codon:yes stop_codon:yes gene_type:complete
MHNKISNTFTFISTFNKEKILNLNKDVGIIFRNYNQKLDKGMLIKLRNFCKKNQRKVYLSNNMKLAINNGFDGAYIPSFNKSLGLKKYSLKKDFLIMGSAHNKFEIYTKYKQGVDMIFISPLFKTKSYTSALGVIKFNLLTRLSNKKIIALGGISERNIKKLKITNASGFSGISYFLND